ncbi:MAG TPA: signal peptidase II, partial [Acidimicrobiales bacterium]
MSDRPRLAGGRHLAAVLVAAATVVFVDQVTKSIALEQLADGPIDVFWTLRFRLSFNTGIAFSIGSGSTAWITGAAIALVVALLVVSRRVSDAWM